MLAKLLKPPKKEKLIETLEANTQFNTLHNVSLSGTRITKLEKEIKIGRQKLIEEELEKRGLPALGADRSNELQFGGYQHKYKKRLF